MKKISVTLVAIFTAIAATQPASAQQITFTGASSSTDGTNGNIRAYSSGGIQVQASAWSYSGSTLQRSFLGQYSTGLGVTNDNEGNGSTSNSHTIDNVGQTDFVLLLFNQSVNIASARLTPYDVSATVDDNDAYVSYASGALPFTNVPTPVALNNAVFASLLAHGFNVPGNMVSPNLTLLNSAGLFGNAWIIGAARVNPDGNDDGFKLTAINVTAAVPEPSTWAMMLIGFGAIGLATRRRRRLNSLPLAI
jgi:PEP-CTERM motif